MIEWNSESEEIYSNGSLEKCMSFSVRISCCLFLHKECACACAHVCVLSIYVLCS